MLADQAVNKVLPDLVNNLERDEYIPEKIIFVQIRPAKCTLLD